VREDRVRQGIEIDDRRPAQKNERGTLPHLREAFGTQEALVLGRHRGDHEDEIALCQHGIEARRLHAAPRQDGIGQPRVERASPCPEPGEQSVQRAPQLAEADEADLRSAEQARGSAAFQPPQLTPLAKRDVGLDDVPGEVERHSQPQFGDRLGEDRGGGDDMNAPREGLAVGHVVEEIALDIEDAPQRRESRQQVFGERRLSDDVARPGEDFRGKLTNPPRAGFHDPVSRPEPRERLRREDQIERARFRRADDDRQIRCRHVSDPCR